MIRGAGLLVGLIAIAQNVLGQSVWDQHVPGQSAAVAGQSAAQVKRIILFKFDGVNAYVLDKWMDARDAQTGRSYLPWMERLFGKNGVRTKNFYVRGVSVSAPSWSMLDSGHHQVIRGNVEYDRWTLEAYDYLNFFPFYFNYSQKKQVDMPGVEVLDDAGIPLLIDRFGRDATWQSFQLYQRGNKWSILERSVPKHFESRSPKDWFDEWQTGVEITSAIPQEMERELKQALNDPGVAYLDFFSGDYDHTAHATNDPASQLEALQSLDALIGRVWTAASASPLGPQTAVVMVSDHGMNTDPDVLSEGYSLVNWFGSAEGGGHHAITDRIPLSDFRLRAMDPFIHRYTTPGPSATYLKGKEKDYPTVALDVDGNERASILLRENAWNVVQILLEQANDEHVPQAIRAACRREVAFWAAEQKPQWTVERAEMSEELAAVDAAEKEAQTESTALDGKWSAEDRAAGKQLPSRRFSVLATKLKEQAESYRKYMSAVDALLAMPADATADLVPKESLGDRNTLFDLQNYVVGLAPAGVVVGPGGRVDMTKSFRRIDYFGALTAIRVRNQVSSEVSAHPVDFTAVALDAKAAAKVFGEDVTGAIWLHRSGDAQAVILYRIEREELWLRYVPVSHLRGQSDGSITFDRVALGPRQPLELFEDPGFAAPDGNRSQWLSGWHTEQEWLPAIVHTRYTNGLIGLTEEFRPLEMGTPGWAKPLSSNDCARVQRYERNRRERVQADLIVLANDHWNFNVRNFNPGGNHGGFFAPSTRSVLMFSGGAETGIPRGLTVDQPYDSLSFEPTVLRLMKLPWKGLPGAPIAIGNDGSSRITSSSPSP